MFTKLYWVETFANGASIGIMPRPRGGDWLADEICHLAELGIQTLVSLLEKEEIRELGLQAEGQLCRDNHIDYIHFPIPDRQLPSGEAAINELVDTLHQKLDDGKKIVLHCRMGIGRASVITGAVLLRKGFHTEQIMEQISRVRGLNVPDTEEQVLWLKKREKEER